MGICNNFIFNYYFTLCNVIFIIIQEIHLLGCCKFKKEFHLRCLFIRLRQYGLAFNSLTTPFQKGDSNLRRQNCKLFWLFHSHSPFKDFKNSWECWISIGVSSNMEWKFRRLLDRPKAKSKQSVIWTPAAIEAFAKCKRSVVQAALLAPHRVNFSLIVFTDASGTMMGTALQQSTRDQWQPLVCFARKPSPLR